MNLPCRMVPKYQADAFHTLADLVQTVFPNEAERPTLVGPDSGYLHPQEWLKGFLGGAGDLVHAVTHHVYIGVDRTNYNDPEKLDSILKNDVSWYNPIIEE